MVETKIWTKQENGFSIAVESHVIGVFDRKENNPLLVEIWLLPYFIPMHPSFSSSSSLPL
ncbi:hypothetical protein AAG906_029366 [Vitis piasezkii]